jgi:Metal-dependent hydrolase
VKLPVMTFNLRTESGTSAKHAWESRSERAAEVIRQFGPLLLGTQEGSRSMLELLKEKLKGFRYIGQGRDGGTNGEYSAIFYDSSLLDVVEEGQFWLSEQPDVPGSKSWDAAFPRICTWAQFQSIEQPAHQWLVFNTHLDHIGQQAREEGILLIAGAIGRMRAHTGLPAVLMGDLNAAPDNPVIRFLCGEVTLKGYKMQLRNAFEAAAARPGATYHNFEGGEEGEPIDYIFATEEIRISQVQIVRSKVNGQFPSDHYPVAAVLEME